MFKDRDANLRDFLNARYGMFVHYGLYSILGRGEWSMNRERIPHEEYRKLADDFTAENFDAEEISDEEEISEVDNELDQDEDIKKDTEYFEPIEHT